MNTTYTAPPEIGRIAQRSLIIGVIGLALCLGGAAATSNLALFFRSYLVAYVFWIGIALGCLALLMVQYLSGGAWGLVIRRLLESASRTFPLLALLFVPLLIGMGSLYEWTHLETITNEGVKKLLKHKEPYLNVPFFIGRTVFYFAVWLWMAWRLNHWSRRQDEAPDPKLQRLLQDRSGPGLLLYGLTVTFAAVDWVMSLNAEWYSTIFGLLLMAGQGLSALAFVIAMAVLLAKREPMSQVYQPRHFHDLGKLMLALNMLWAYFSFSQFLIIWSGNLPEEIPWYLERLKGGWGYLGLALVLFHFALPFALLLSRDLKRNGRKLAAVALVVIIMRGVDLIWMIAPEFAKHGEQHAADYLMYAAAPFGIGGIWLWWFIRQLRSRPLLPLNDPHLDEAIAPEHH
jgi:hypothetical protein